MGFLTSHLSHECMTPVLPLSSFSVPVQGACSVALKASFPIKHHRCLTACTAAPLHGELPHLLGAAPSLHLHLCCPSTAVCLPGTCDLLSLLGVTSAGTFQVPGMVICDAPGRGMACSPPVLSECKAAAAPTGRSGIVYFSLWPESSFSGASQTCEIKV